ncbi:hypothetical protein [Halarcobacter ebronensis]|uniref:Uncharacterized protein n=1 Tax=Halarcobacter ebronensis TaxID=1462615 RepID=A0A4Q1AHQ5_9BACT|nr:hypothetical protein [Halarcobacter ebronensis]QKF81152.1 putative membrane protein [Halarcobacter ebronensis]RXK03273.1 hypothetical protein CRV07_12845 [Halarcobacter ebronensis]
MGLKAYIGFSLLLIVVIGITAFGIEGGNYEVKFFDFSLNLPVVAWVLLPMIVLFVLSLLHLIFYGSVNYFKNRAYLKDEETILESLKTFLLQKEEKNRLSTNGFKTVFNILSQLKLDVKDNTFTSSSEELNKIVSNIKDIKAGKFVSEKEIKLDSNSELAKQNLINKINEQADYSLDILKKSEQYPEEVVKIAFFNVLENKAMTTIKKVYENVKLDKEMAYKLFLKDSENIEFGFTKDELLKIIKPLNYSKKEFITLAKLYKEVLSPDRIIELFETLSEENEEALDAYLYILCELEMIDSVRDILSGHDKNELVAFRALIDLKEAGKQYSLDNISYNN